MSEATGYLVIEVITPWRGRKTVSAAFALEELTHLAGVVGSASPEVRLRPCSRYEFADDEARALVRDWLLTQRIHQVPTPAFDLGTLIQYQVPQIVDASRSIH